MKTVAGNRGRRTQLSSLLRDIRKISNIEALTGEYIPMPPTSDRKGNYLVLNCTYTPLPEDEEGNVLLHRLRSDAKRILRSIEMQTAIGDFETVFCAARLSR